MVDPTNELSRMLIFSFSSVTRHSPEDCCQFCFLCSHSFIIYIQLSLIVSKKKWSLHCFPLIALVCCSIIKACEIMSGLLEAFNFVEVNGLKAYDRLFIAVCPMVDCKSTFDPCIVHAGICPNLLLYTHYIVVS